MTTPSRFRADFGLSMSEVVDFDAEESRIKTTMLAGVGITAIFLSVAAIFETNLTILGGLATLYAVSIPVAAWVAIGIAGIVIGGVSIAILLKHRKTSPYIISALGGAAILVAAMAIAETKLAVFGGTAAAIAAAIPIGGWIALGVAGLVVGGAALYIKKREKDKVVALL